MSSLLSAESIALEISILIVIGIIWLVVRRPNSENQDTSRPVDRSSQDLN
jgi:hypothetical protein